MDADFSYPARLTRLLVLLCGLGLACGEAPPTTADAAPRADYTEDAAAQGALIGDVNMLGPRPDDGFRRGQRFMQSRHRDA